MIVATVYIFQLIDGGSICQIIKDIELTVDGSRTGFRLSKLDTFSGVMLLRLLLRLENQNTSPTMPDLIASLSEDELRSVMKSEIWTDTQKHRRSGAGLFFLDYWISKVRVPSTIFRVMVPFSLTMGPIMLSPPSTV